MHLPRLRELERRLAADDIRAIHITTPGPAGLTARYLAHRTGLPLVGSLHTSSVPLFQAWRRAAARWPSASVMPRLPPLALRRMLEGAGPVRRRRSPVDERGMGRRPARRLAGGRRRGCVLARAAVPAAPQRMARLGAAAGDSVRRTPGRQSGVELIEPLGSLLHRHGHRPPVHRGGRRDGLPALQESCPGRRVCRPAVPSGPRDGHGIGRSAALAEGGQHGGAGAARSAGVGPAGRSRRAGAMRREHVRPGLTGLVCRPDDVLGLLRAGVGAPDGYRPAAASWAKPPAGLRSRARGRHRSSASTSSIARRAGPDDSRACASDRAPASGRVP